MKLSLLMVDDDPDDQELARLGFKSAGFQVELETAPDGVDALRLLVAARAAGRPLPAAIVTDIKMPRMDGLELLRRLKEEPLLRDIPVLVLSSSSREADVSEARRLGASRYFQKPANLSGYASIAAEIQEAAAAAGSTPRTDQKSATPPAS